MCAGERRLQAGPRSAQLALLGVLACGSGLANADKAEYSVRWNVAAGGPKTIEDVFAALGKSPPSKKGVLTVVYSSVNQPASLAPGYKALVRERWQAKGGVDWPEAMYKLRGPEQSAGAVMAAWTCPLRGGAGIEIKGKGEYDVAWTTETEFRRIFSVSCTAKGATVSDSLPANHAAKPLPCRNKVERHELGKITVEFWTLHSGAEVIEVSRGGENVDGDAKEFAKKVVAPLVKRGAKPVVQGMTELGSSC